MKAVLLTREYPPDVYGGAGVHVEYLARELARLIDVEVRCFGAERPTGGPGEPIVRAFEPWEALTGPDATVLRLLSVDLAMANDIEGASLVHSHTWYANLAGHLAKELYGIPHVVTTHSLEPLRPWKAEQLGEGGYGLSRFVERTALEHADSVVAVSRAMRADILEVYPQLDPARVRVISNGIDAEEYAPDHGTNVLDRLGVDPDRPSILFVGRITHQKGVTHLLDAAASMDPAAQLVLCAGAPDTPEIEEEVSAKVRALQERRGNVVWIREMLPKPSVIQLLTHASVFVCPSIYEPQGIVNLEAMACGTAVVATAVGGIPEVVVHGETGLLVPFEPGEDHAPRDGEALALGLADAVNELLADPSRARLMGKAGRERVLARFTWGQIAARTVELYEEVLPG
ncbi:MAG TPA: glycogen synthase [Actinomycetota bacterium]|nr:glycogen synthase [Actinomycetota bacterium]